MNELSFSAAEEASPSPASLKTGILPHRGNFIRAIFLILMALIPLLLQRIKALHQPNGSKEAISIHSVDVVAENGTIEIDHKLIRESLRS